MTERFISMKELIKRVPYTTRHFYTLEKQGVFPRRVKLSPKGRAIAYLESEIDAWIKERAAARDVENGGR